MILDELTKVIIIMSQEITQIAHDLNMFLGYFSY